MLALAVLAGAPGCVCGGTGGDSDAAADATPGTDAAGGSDAAPGSDAALGSDAGSDAGAGGSPTLALGYADPCDCATPPCCPTVALDYISGGAASAWYVFCGDAVACDPPPVGWELMNAVGTWDRLSSPGVSASSAELCAPGTWVNPWGNSVPMPPSGTVRAVGLFDAECGAAACTTACGAPFEVLSNAISVP